MKSIKTKNYQLYGIFGKPNKQKEPATDRQMDYCRRLGYIGERLTKGQAGWYIQNHGKK